jgi:O-succinylbenzoic acid--CoA ligase
MQVPLTDWLAYRAANTPERAALVFGTRRWSYAELDAEATRTALQLAGVGVRSGDRVAMLLHNGVAPAVLAHAVLRLGATLVPLNVRLSEDELAWQIADCGALVVVVEGRTVELIVRLRRELVDLLPVSVDEVGAAMLGSWSLAARIQSDAKLHMRHDPAHVLAIVYTSGTTGQPKGAMLTVGNFWWSAIGSALNLGTCSDDRWLACMPLFHVGGLSIVLRSAIYGITAVVQDGFDADAVNAALDGGGVTIVSVVAVMLERMLDARGDVPYPSSLRCVLLGGGPAPHTLLERCAVMGVPVAQTYGLTETTSQLCTLAPADALRKLGAAGRPIYPNEIRVVTDGHDAAPGEAGEILVRGPVVTVGYAGQPEATARAIVNGWLHTGDIGSLDSDGYLYVLDRRDDLIITGGENVYPAEVEAALLAHPWITEAGVIGVPDITWGQRVVAIVCLGDHPAMDTDALDGELRAHCLRQLASYKTPREFRVVTEPIPRTASGKVRRSALREQASAPGFSRAPTGS